MYTDIIRLYDDREDVTLTTYIQADAEVLLSGARRPAVLICPGGAYMKCASQEAEPVALRFAAMGYHAFVLRYSTYFSMSPTEEFPKDREAIEYRAHCVYPAPIREIGKAFMLIRELSETWLIDTERIILCGFSAGAHNVAMYAENWDKPVICDYFNEKKERFRPAALILCYMAGDFYLQEKPQDKEKDLFFRVSYMALAGKQELTEEEQSFFAPAEHISAGVPPAFLWATYGDQTVSVKNTVKMAMALAEADIPFECHIFEEGNHGLSLAAQGSAKITEQIRPDVAKWVDLAETWLLKRFALQLPQCRSDT